jgi:clathrin heavy chain
MQLFSKARNVSQPLEGHAATFGTIRLDGATTDTKLFAFAVKSTSGEAKIKSSLPEALDPDPLACRGHW